MAQPTAIAQGEEIALRGIGKKGARAERFSSRWNRCAGELRRPIEAITAGANHRVLKDIRGDLDPVIQSAAAPEDHNGFALRIKVFTREMSQSEANAFQHRVGPLLNRAIAQPRICRTLRVGVKERAIFVSLSFPRGPGKAGRINTSVEELIRPIESRARMVEAEQFVIASQGIGAP